jgi:hypothetical protein
MAKKIRNDEDDDFENELENENESDTYQEETAEEETESDEESHLDLGSDDEDIEIVIEIDEDELDLTKEEPTSEEGEATTEENDIVLSKHKIEGKHSLKYDSIFKGKKEDPLSEDDLDGFSAYYKETIEVDKSSIYHHESIDNEAYIRSKLVKEKVYEVLRSNTQLNFLNNRRKPSKIDFNTYYELLRSNLQEESFTNIELFNELAVYFSDNLFNMFKLLDNKWRNLIIKELQDHIGKNVNSKEITNRNIYEGTEIEFKWQDALEGEKIITGVVIFADYQKSEFRIDSYENIYEIKITSITKILNNSKFKYNLNKLNNIDFL